MAFGPESNNPRERRSYAHAALYQARQSVSVEDLLIAQQAVLGAITTAKGKRSGLAEALTNAALLDVSTRVIVEKSKEVLDPNATPRTYVDLQTQNKSLAFARRYSPDFDLTYGEGSTMGRTEVVDMSSGLIDKFTQLEITDHAGDRKPHIIPTTSDGEVDIFGVRLLPDDRRAKLAKIAAPIEMVEPKPYVHRPNHQF